jgi:two-component system sensor histidine kinase DesK
VLAWAVREGATNALRHSTASSWNVTAGVTGTRAGAGADRLFLEIANDGVSVGEDGPRGRGLAGLDERARAAGGTSTAGPRDDGWFVLRVEIPELAANPREAS